MAIKLVDKNNLFSLPKTTYTIQEVLEVFVERAPDDSESAQIINAAIIYQTEDGFAHAVLNYDKLTNLVGAVEMSKNYLIQEILTQGEVIYDDIDD